MKRWFIGFLAIVLVLWFMPMAFAQTPWPDRGEKGAAKDAPPKAEPAPALKFGLNNLSGDFGLIWKGTDGGAAVNYGIGLDFVNYKQGLLTLRAQAFFESEELLGNESAAIVGISVMANLIKVIGLVPETSWLANAINPSIGIFGGYDFASGKPAYGPMLSIINVQF